MTDNAIRFRIGVRVRYWRQSLQNAEAADTCFAAFRTSERKRTRKVANSPRSPHHRTAR